MCSRYTILSPHNLHEEFDPDEIEAELDRPRYNIAPTQAVPIVLARDRRRILTTAHWGLVPAWAKDRSIATRLINARAETIGEKPAFRDAILRRRCLVPADGFFEWIQNSRPKQPVYFTLEDGRPFAFAGLYEIWRAGQADELQSCTIITTEPNELVQPVHCRMPVMLTKENYEQWLTEDADDWRVFQKLLVPFDARRMRSRTVSTHMNSSRNDDPKCIEPVEPPDSGTLF